MVRPLLSGNALHVSLVPPAGAKVWRVLRKGDDSFTGHDDPNAAVICEGDDRFIVDAGEYLQNDVPLFYKAYYFDGSVWSASATATGTPRATYSDASTDVLDIVRDRLAAGMAVEIARGTFTTKSGYIQVLTAPPTTDGGVELPVVTVHLINEEPAERGIGEMIEPDEYDELSGEWVQSEGWLSRVQLEVVVWSLNPTERSELRKAARRIIVANLPVFDAAGMVQISMSQQHVDALGNEFASNIFQVVCSITCLAPVRVSSTANKITTVEVSASGELPNQSP